MLNDLMMKWIGSSVRTAAAGWGGYLIKLGLLHSDQLSQFEGAAVLLATLAWSGWEKYGHVWLQQELKRLNGMAAAQKVPKSSIGLFLACIVAMSLFHTNARAAGLLTKAPVAPAVATPLCGPTSCTLFYGTVFAGGLADNANIIGNGINGSLNAGGMLPGAGVGWQYFDGKIYFAIEGDLGYQFQSSVNVDTLAGSHNGIFGIVQVKAGAALSSLLPSQSPISFALPYAILTPYIATGELFQQGGGGGGSVVGAGVIFQLPSPWLADAEYLNSGSASTAGQVTTKQNNIVMFGIKRGFSF